ncbi:MAG: HD domain-containing protein [Firmicutes bacterium]|nr:HD domain-containing protein [Bacillota bacterium]
MTEVINAIETIAKNVAKAGGRAYLVGGCVRDKLMGTAPKDYDIEVHGIEPETLRHILEEIGEPMSVGESFGIYSLKGLDLDIAMPRREHAIGRGHRDFEVEVDPFIGVEKAASRRDFTINALMEDALTGEIIDPFGGRQDLKAGVIRHVNDDSFREDPLRVFRGAQFAARFGFGIASETLEICKTMAVSELSPERVEGELKKAMVGSAEPSIFFEVLREMDQLEPWFHEIKALIGLEQDPLFHPEGDVWNHTMEVLDRGAALRYEAEEPYGFMLLCLTHDLGKITTTSFEKGRIHAYDHETEGLPIATEFLERLIGARALKDYVLGMIPSHMKPNMVAYSRSKVKTTNRMFDEVPSPRDLILFSVADRPVMAGNFKFQGDRGFLEERLEIYEKTMSEPYVMGKDLIEAGLEPGEDFREILGYAHKLRLAGISKSEALKQALSYAKKLRNNKT